jgi:hypothetical protein
MASDLLIFEVHYKGSFNRENRCTYVGGFVHNHYVHEVHKMSFLDIEEICKEYGYKYGDLIHYKIPDRSLDDGLRLISSDHNVSEMVSYHEGHYLAELYLVSFEAVEVDVEDDNAEEDEEYERIVVCQKDALWDEVLIVDIDNSDSDRDEHVKSERVGGVGGVEDEENRDDELERGETEEGVFDGDPHMDAYVEELRGEDDVDDADSKDLCPSDVLRSPIPNDSDGEDISSQPDVTKMVQFIKDDLRNPML